jgi:hypothetical protein
VTGQTDPKEILALIESLKPKHCGKPLIRIGGAGDGGYLLPDDLKGIEYCFSPGVGTKADFEKQLSRLNIRSFLADYSVEGPPFHDAHFTFDKKFLGETDTDKIMTLASWKNKYLKTYRGDLLLQMDIEGHEFEVIMNSPDDLLAQFRIIVVEFHSLDRLFEPPSFSRYKSCFAKLTSKFVVAHIHPNNCCGNVVRGSIEIPKLIEVTFYNKKRVVNPSPRKDFPHPLDRDNVPGKPTLVLPKCWYA